MNIMCLSSRFEYGYKSFSNLEAIKKNKLNIKRFETNTSSLIK